jgi:hypothetical protein
MDHDSLLVQFTNMKLEGTENVFPHPGIAPFCIRPTPVLRGDVIFLPGRGSERTGGRHMAITTHYDAAC